MSTLRENKPATTTRENANVDQAPSFYEDDLKKKETKYGKSIKDRQQFKRTYFASERRTVLAGNDNFVE